MTIIATGALVYRRPKVPEHLWSKSHNQEFELYIGTAYLFLIFSMLSMRATHRTGIDWIVSMYINLNLCFVQYNFAVLLGANAVLLQMLTVITFRTPRHCGTAALLRIFVS